MNGTRDSKPADAYGRFGAPIARGRTAEIFDLGDGRVLKLFREGWTEASAERELTIARRLREAGIPAPEAFGTEQISGRSGVVLERIDGRAMLDLLAARPWQFRGHAVTLAKLHVQVHGARVDGLRSHRERLRHEIDHARPLSPAAREASLRLLDALPDGDALCHGDFHPDNVIMSPSGPRIIDWADASSGPPLADVARSLVLSRFGPLAEPVAWRRFLFLRFARLFLRRYRAEYLSLTGADPAVLRQWEVVSAAARLNTDIPAEHPALLRFVETGLRRETA